MTTAYTSLLGLALPVQGELTGVWGDTVNNSITSLLDTSVAGTTNVSTDTDVTLTTTTGAANTARQAILLFSGARTALRTVTAPAQSKIYTVINATTGGFSVKLVGAGPTTGVTIVAGESAVCAWNGSDFVKVSNTGGTASFTNVTVTGTTTLSGLTASTALALDASKNVVSVTNTGTGNNVLSASPTLTGTIDAAALTASGNVTLSGGTANGVAYLNGSKVVTSGSALTFDGTSFGVKAATTESTNVNIGGGRSGSGYAYLDLIGDAAQASSYSARLIRGNGGANTTTSLIHKGTGALEFTASDAGYLTYNINGSEQMRLTSTGLGIGTSSPSQKLHVVGNALVTPSGGWTTGGVATQYFGDIYGSIKYDYNTTNFLISSYGTFSIATNGTSPTTRLIVDASGNLGLGVTPSAWGSDTKAIQLGGSTFSALAGNARTLITANAYNDGTNFKYINTGSAFQYRLSTGTSQHEWYTAPSGSAGANITFTQAMTLDASGRLLVGATSSAGGGDKRLQVGSTGSSTTQILAQSATTSLSLYASSAAEFYAAYATGSAFILGNGPADASTFTERARIDSSGNLLVGTTTSASKLTLNGTQTFVEGSDTRVGTIRFASGGFNVTSAETELNLVTPSSSIVFLTGAAGTAAERARVTPEGNMGIGTSSPASRLDVVKQGNSSGGTIMMSGSKTNNQNKYGNLTGAHYASSTYPQGICAIGVLATTDDNFVDIGGNVGEQIASNTIRFWTAANTTTSGGTERARIDSSGNLLVGTTSGSSKVEISSSTQTSLNISTTGVAWSLVENQTNAGTQYFARFDYNGSAIGSIQGSNTTTAYNTSSDYRLKNTIAPMTGALAKVALLKPCTYKWNADGSDGEGFIAHELAEVCPQAVSGEKDAVNEDGSIKPQGIDVSFLVATLTAAIQEQQAIIESLKARLDAANL